MTNQELCAFIKNYLEHDKTRTAIMLTAPWGAGKSYFIENELKEYLACKCKKKYRMVVVTLYGLKDISEISKSIYIELRTSGLKDLWKKFLAKNIVQRLLKKLERIKKPAKEAAALGEGLGKTILKGLAGKIGFDIDISDKSLHKLYRSIDLSECLIVLEDLERTSIDVLDVLGFVYGLVNDDHAKVLLVANEDEIIQYEPINEKTQEKQATAELLDRLTDHEGRQYTETTKEYLKVKEKTVSDTIIFEGDNENAVKQILTYFSKNYFSDFFTGSNLKELLALLKNGGITNLRVVIFACQKANNLLERIKPDPLTEDDYIKTIFFGILLFSNRFRNGITEKWDGGSVFSAGLSTEKYPLYRFCYNYITRQEFDPSLVTGTKEELKKLRMYSQNHYLYDKDLVTLENWWLSSVREVIDAITSIANRLQNEESIPFYQYGKIAVNMIRAKTVIGDHPEIEKAKELLVKNLHNKGGEIDADYLFLGAMIDEKNTDILSEYNELKKQMTEALAAKETTIFDFDYQPSSIIQLSDAAYQNRGRILRDGAFAARLDMKKIAVMLQSCTASDIYQLRAVFHAVYNSGNIRDFLAGDREAIIALMGEVKSLEAYEGYDKIQQFHIQKMYSDLDNIASRLKE